MPIYEYSCAKCGDTIEVIQKMSDTPLDRHEGCGGTLEKLISAAAIQFKGTGWYVTDYGRKSTGESSNDGKTGKSGKAEKAESAPKETSSNGSKESGSDKPASAKATSKE